MVREFIQVIITCNVLLLVHTSFKSFIHTCWYHPWATRVYIINLQTYKFLSGWCEDEGNGSKAELTFSYDIPIIYGRVQCIMKQLQISGAITSVTLIFFGIL